ncbi:MAG TPA: nucleoside deaminase [Sediminibacterium sp.]|nr:nucleoside deaminase [Sediminibacterium sp.]
MQSAIFYIAATLRAAEAALQAGDLPFGCILVSPEGNILLEGRNTVVSNNDPIGHCEINLVHEAGNLFPPEYLRQCTVYASTEPCPMCAAALYWLGVGKLVYGLRKEIYHQINATADPAHILDLPAAAVLGAGGRKMEINGPCEETWVAAWYRQQAQSSK